ncbi:MAG TPA: NADH-quinone oxidoreductase subunit NuoK [Chitinophagaceae bacterium]
MQLDTAMDHGLSTLELITLKKLIMPFDSQTVLIVAAILFMLGLVGVLTRRNIIFILISVEIMLNAAGLAFVAAGTRWGQPDGQVMFLFILAMAASEVSVGLALVMQAYRQHKTLNVDELRALRDEGE